MMYGTGSVWMFVMPVIWIGLIALIIWAVFRHTRARRDGAARERAQEDLRRRFARGEISAEEFAASVREPGPAPASTTTEPRNRWLPLAVLIAAAGLLAASIVGVSLGAASPTAGNGYGPDNGGPMMPGPDRGSDNRAGT
ncbi:SHOCT domain-containing protein [Amycolatopsis pigmentata]|uniref:SHOCT domain-containing protein n=1 Tax=Amycolatopsis pigmentata TaxID=450801 RepID=A0ABW5G2H4_9PSEU